MKPSDFNTSSTRPRMVDAGVETVSRRRICALRMRVSMSPMGSFRAIPVFSLPARLDHAGHLPEIAQRAQGNAAQLELAVVAARTPAELAAVAHAARRRIARQGRELQLRREALFHAHALVLAQGLQLGALARKLLAQLPAAIVLFDRAG